LRNIFKEKELDRDSVVAYFAATAMDGKTCSVEYFNLDAVISVGYRVNSKRGTQFRIWATSVLRDHLLKGYSMNDRRLRELNQTIRLIADMAGRREQPGRKEPPDPYPHQPDQQEGTVSQAWPISQTLFAISLFINNIQCPGT
jgi:hypothetical protein